MVAGILSVVTYYSPTLHLYLSAVFAYILVSDLGDGFLSRRWGATTRLGALLDYVVDRFNFYLMIGVLIHAGLSPLVFLPWFLRDLVYVGVQAYIAMPNIRGTKALSFAGTITTYAYVLYLNHGGVLSLGFTATLFLTLTGSLANLVVRVFRVRNQLAQRFAEDIL